MKDGLEWGALRARGGLGLKQGCGYVSANEGMYLRGVVKVKTTGSEGRLDMRGE